MKVLQRFFFCRQIFYIFRIFFFLESYCEADFVIRTAALKFLFVLFSPRQFIYILIITALIYFLFVIY